MEKRELVSSFSAFTGDKIFINRAQVRRFMGIGNDKAQGLLAGLEFIKVGRERKYFVTDVATRILEMRRVSDGS